MRLVCLVLVLAACGDNSAGIPPDAAPADAPPADAPPDPFADMFDDPSDFPRTGCTPGALAGFAHEEIWIDLRLRTEASPLRTFRPRGLHHEEEVPHLHTDDDLLVRSSSYGPLGWELQAFDICGVDPDGTLHGSRVTCLEWSDPPCRPPLAFTAPPFRRTPGEAEGEHLTLLGEIGADWPGASSNVRVDGDVAFVSRFDDGLRIVSIADPAAPVELAHFALPLEYANDLKLVKAGGRRYVVTASGTANIIDVTDPANPQLVAQLPFAPHTVFVEDTTAYLVDGASGAIEIWDLADPRAPVQRGSWEHPDPQIMFHDLYVQGGIAYVSDINFGGTGLNVIDLRAPNSPVVLGAEPQAGFEAWHSPWLTTVAGKAVAIDGTEFSSIGMRLLDGDPASPTFLTTLGEWSNVRGSAHNVMAIGSIVYMAHYREGVRVIDIANPASPQLIGYFNVWPLDNGPATAADLGTFGIDLDPARKRIYVADSVRGLVILQGDATVFP